MHDRAKDMTKMAPEVFDGRGAFFGAGLRSEDVADAVQELLLRRLQDLWVTQQMLKD